MRALRLRRYDAASAAMQAVCRYWQGLGNPMLMGSPPPGAILAQATALNGTELLVDLRTWFDQSLPEKSALRADLIAADEIRDLFHYSGAVLSLSLPGEAAEPLAITKLTAADVDGPQLMPRVTTSCGGGWLLKVAKQYHDQLSQGMPSLLHGGIPLRLDFILGHSQLSVQYVKKLETGDVLLINQLTETVMTGNRMLAKYRQQEDYFMLEDIYDDDEDENDRYPGLHDNQAIQQRRIGINNIPVQLTFIIHQSTLTLDELALLHIGDVLAAGGGGENSITICANGALLAKGELVMANEQLGVEIQTLCYEAQYGE